MPHQDQIQALEFLDENIEAFGGNPHAVTIMGHDIGAAFVGYHLISKITPSFFHRAVLLGGAPTQPHMFNGKTEAYQAAFKFATELGCINNSNSVKQIIECLMKVDAVAIWDVQTLFHSTENNAVSFDFVPTDDSHVLEASPIELLETMKGKATQIMIGGTSHEGSIPLINTVPGINSYRATRVSRDKFVRIVNHIFKKFNSVEIAAILHEYKNWADLTDEYANQLRIAELFGDYYFTCPMRKFSDYWSARGLNTYYYVFSHMSTALGRTEWIGAAHGDEIDFMFGVPLRFPDQFITDEVELSRNMINILANFIKKGNPGIEWERYGRETPHYLNVTLLTKQERFGPHLKTCDFWNNLFPQMVQIRFPFSVGHEDVLKKTEDPPYRIDDHCTVTFTNCSGSDFAIYTGRSSNSRTKK